MSFHIYHRKIQQIDFIYKLKEKKKKKIHITQQ